ncbi:hypothetical protein [Chryseobacterium sp. ISL-6]|uniref:hypothetical protein n=1 Tax=Chryseobacterium sp. ISL-6 TaxID=2819143 RepID=UPI001BE7F493|nr:hypothetical protein [Chryseobacterium sp. ISL-6]MBT2622509.1 hypothetical protein [Chryseobacterium sp. ISL-6]
MPIPTSQPYYPQLSSLITLDSIPSELGFVKNLSQNIFKSVYYKDYQTSSSLLGDSAFHSLNIVSKERIQFDLIYGLKFILNRDFQNNNISSFPVTVQYNWPILAYISQFNLDNFSFSPKEIFKVAMKSLNLTDEKVINEAINIFINSNGNSIQQFVNDINSSLGLSIPSPTLSYNMLKDLADSLNSLYEEGAMIAVFSTYILENGNLSQTKSNLQRFFKNILPGDIEEYILNLIKPKALITLETSASIEFPRNILKPWITNSNGELMPDPNQNAKTYFDFAKAVLYADTISGVGYDLDIAGTLSNPYSEIGNTGLLVQLESLKLDLSKTKNIPEADAYGYSPDFTGVYARAISITLPPKWFYDESNPPTTSTTTLRLGGYDLLVGTGGVSGTIMLESVPVASQGTSFEYYNDKFVFNYPILVYDKNTQGEIVKVVIDDYQKLKDVLGDMNASSDAPFPFHFPLSLTPLGQTDPLFFDKAENYQNYLSTLRGNSDMLWKRLGGENGFQVGFKSFDVTLNQNSIVSSNIKGGLRIPKFKYPDDVPVFGGQEVQIEVDGHIEADGDFRLSASTIPPFPIQLGNVFKLHLSSVELGKEDGKFFIGASADVEFLGTFGELLKGQTLSISTLRIYSDGSIDFRVNGGNMTLPKPIKIPIGPVEVSVTAIHFGSHERVKNGVTRKYNYFGFDGGVSIGVAGIDARGDGIKYYYTIDDDVTQNKLHDSYLHIQTIHVDMVIPANSSDPTVSIKGWLSIPEPGEFQEYQGGVSLKVKNPRITGGVDMRLAPKYPAFLIDANIELPNPIALGPVSIYGFRGLLGYRYVAEKKAINMTSENTWYEYYTAPARGVGVKKFSRPDQTEQYSFPFSLGVGALLGDTMANGNIISANAMLLLSLPSMVMVDARMKLLSSRVTYQDDPPFFAFFIFGDNSLEFGFGADYKFPEESGDIIKLYAEIQAGFFFNNPSAWYINFGTKQNPIQAKLLKDLFTLKAFLMISGKGIEAGARGEFRFDRKFGPVKIFVLAYLELGGKISFQKPQMGAYFEAGLAIDIDVKIIRIYAAVTILLAVESPKPFLIYGAFSVAFKLKILFFKISFSVKVELKWEFNKTVERDPVNPFTEIQDQTDSLVKGVSMLTNETFDLQQVSPDTIPAFNSIKNVVPLDTYIDIKTTKGLRPNTVTNSVIGGYTSAAGNSVDLIPPDKVMKGLELRQVKHQYSLEKIEILGNDGTSGWVPYDPFKAMEPNNPELNNLKVGQWQKKDNQYNAIRLLGMTPFSYTEQGNPGWFIPEQYGVLASTLFCEGQHIESSVSDFLEKPLNTLYYASTSNFFQSEGASYQISGDVQYTVDSNGNPVMQGDHAQVSDEINLYGFNQSLLFKNHSSLTIMLPNPSKEVSLKLSTYSTGVTVAYYSPLVDLTNTQSVVQYDVQDKYYSKDELQNPISPDNIPTNGITKIVITPDVTDNAQIDLVLQQMAVLMDQGYQIALDNGGIVDPVLPSDPALYAELEYQLAQLQSQGCEGTRKEKYEIVCKIYPELVKYYNNNFILPFDRKNPSPGVKEYNYVRMINENIESGTYDYILDILQSSGIPSDLLIINVEQYNKYLLDLKEYINGNPDNNPEIIARFEILKTKLKQINNLLQRMNLCVDQKLCNLATNLSAQEFGEFSADPVVSNSPLLNAYYIFIKENPGYEYLNEILRRQIVTIETIIKGGWNDYSFFKTLFDNACREIISILKDLGNCVDQKKCFTLFHEIKWMSVEDYAYNVDIPTQDAITQDAQAAVTALTKSVQPIWRPDTSYYVRFKLKDTVDNGLNAKEYSYAYTFRTGGPLGFFHLDKDATYGEIKLKDQNGADVILEDTTGEIRDTNGTVIDHQTPHPDQYPHTSLRAYIDYQRSYPNADGNIVSAKPLFYDDETTKISLYFTSSYVSKLLGGWEKYGDMEKLGGAMKIIIKDPVEGISIINPPILDATYQDIVTSPVDIPQTFEEWANDDNPAIPPVMNQYFNLLNSGVNCTGIITMVKPKSTYRIATPKKLKPQKLYTAQVLNFYWGTDTIDLANITEQIKQDYAKEVHKFVFQTSRYKDFEAQVSSYLIDYKDENGLDKKKPAVYSIEKSLTADKINAAWDIINTDPKNVCTNPLSQAIAMQYQHPFDRIVQGLFGVTPQEDAPTTEFNKIIDPATGKVIAILVRNPEPFNHPKIPIENINRVKGSTVDLNDPKNQGMIEVVKPNSSGKLLPDSNYSMIYSKDYAQALIMNTGNSIVENEMNFQFIYKVWNGDKYDISKTIVAKNIKINE